MKIPHLSVLTARFLMPKDYICQRTLYKAISRPFCISAMNVPLERVHSWMCVSVGSDCRRDCRVVSSMSCMVTPCMVTVAASAGSVMSCSKRDFSIDLNVETFCPSQVRLYVRKSMGQTPPAPRLWQALPANKLSPRYAQASTVCLAGMKLPDFGARTKS